MLLLLPCLSLSLSPPCIYICRGSGAPLVKGIRSIGHGGPYRNITFIFYLFCLKKKWSNYFSLFRVPLHICCRVIVASCSNRREESEGIDAFSEYEIWATGGGRSVRHWNVVFLVVDRPTHITSTIGFLSFFLFVCLFKGGLVLLVAVVLVAGIVSSPDWLSHDKTKKKLNKLYYSRVVWWWWVEVEMVLEKVESSLLPSRNKGIKGNKEGF